MAWWIWVVVALALGIVELATITFVLLWIAVAALLTALTTWVVPNLWAQVAIFAALSIALYVVSRPLARKLRNPARYQTHVETLAGKTGVVIHPAEPGGLATTRIEGELWSARSPDHLEPDDTVVVVEATGTVLTVKLLERHQQTSAQED